MRKLKISTIIITLFAVLFIIIIFVFPSESIEAAKYGLNLWFNVLFPSQFPFIIGANILISVGAVNFIGTLLESFMLDVFNICGKGSFPFILGSLSGCPVGAKITADLRDTKQISVYDANKLMSICNNPAPLFMIGTVSIGMFKKPSLAVYIVIIIYISVFITGLIFRFYGTKTPKETRNKNILKKAYRNQINSRINNYKTLGAILGESVVNAMEIVMKIGGFVIFFSVISKILDITHIISILEYILSPIFLFLNIDKSLHKAILLGIIEITNGIDAVSLSSAPLKQKIIAALCLLSWNGLSIHTQVISMIGHTDIKASLYIIAKLLQTIIAGTLGFIFFSFIIPLT